MGELRHRLAAWRSETIVGLPPFQRASSRLRFGSIVEGPIPRGPLSEFQVPALAIGLYDVVLAVDHLDGRAWLISQGNPEREPAAQQRGAAADRAVSRGSTNRSRTVHRTGRDRLRR